MSNSGGMIPLCYRCNHKVTSHAVDDEARAECMECDCHAWENSPDGRPIVQTERWRDEFCRLVAARDAIVVERDQARRCSAAWKALAKRQQHRIDAMREYTPDKEDADK